MTLGFRTSPSTSAKAAPSPDLNGVPMAPARPGLSPHRAFSAPASLINQVAR